MLVPRLFCPTMSKTHWGKTFALTSTDLTAAEFQNFCQELGIKINYESVTHPQSNGQVEKANCLVCGGLKKRLLAALEQAAGNWVEELPAVLWSLRTTPNSSTKHTPFFLV